LAWSVGEVRRRAFFGGAAVEDARDTGARSLGTVRLDLTGPAANAMIGES